MRRKFLKWLKEKFPMGSLVILPKQREVTPELRERIKAEFPGYHLAKNGSGRRKKLIAGATVTYQTDDFIKEE